MVRETHLPDVLIAGAGIIGLSLALELRSRGAAVTVLDKTGSMRGASIAAAGMLAAEDPHNPPALAPLGRLSLSLYPTFLARIEELSGQSVPFQTDTTVQYLPQGAAQRLAEHSLDPRQLAPALLAAARSASIRLLEGVAVKTLEVTATGVEVRTDSDDLLRAGHLVHTSGAWGVHGSVAGRVAVSPRKGQMLRVRMPADAPLREVYRAGHVYVVPRTLGPQAGTALIGATVEDVGFDLTTDADQLEELRKLAAALGPATTFTASAPLVEAWAGLRPSTPDGLPLIGQLDVREWIATGHYRNGILLAPGTATVLADLILGVRPAVDLSAFTPGRLIVP